MMVLVQSSFHTTWASLFEMELEPNLLDWNVNELEHELELEDMKRTTGFKVNLLMQNEGPHWIKLIIGGENLKRRTFFETGLF